MNDNDFIVTLRIAACVAFLVFLTLAMTGCATKPPELTPEEEQAVAVGCDNNPECMLAVTDEIIASKILQLEYEREDRRIRQFDKLIIYLNACDKTKGLVVLEKIKIGRSKLPNKRAMRNARREYGYAYTHDNVSPKLRQHDVVCVDIYAFKEMMERSDY